MNVLGPLTWLRALRGERRAILALASAPAAFPAGLFFALSAGFAREYDGEYLVREPWYVLVPALASALAATLFWLAFFRPWRGGAPSWRAFVGLFWMSAPLAWLYAIPYERFLEPLAAFEANLWTLAAVSVWRVAWMTRVLSELRRVALLPTFLGVLLIADLVVMGIAWFAPKSVILIMGGVRGSELERAIGDTNLGLLVFSSLALPVLLIAAAVARAFRRAETELVPTVGGGRALLRCAQVATLVWLPLLVWTQPEQARRWSAERDLGAGRIREALRAMSAHEPGDYPPGWDPPPHLYLGDARPDIGAVLDVLIEEPVADWVSARFVPKTFHVYHGEFEEPSSTLRRTLSWQAQISGEERARKTLEFLARHDAGLTEEQRAAVGELQARVRQGERLAPEESPP